MIRPLALALVAAGSAMHVAGCFSAATDCQQDYSCVGVGDGGITGDGGDATTDGTIGDGALADVRVHDTDPNCFEKSDPATTPCIIDEVFGAFVDPTAKGASDGSRDHPFATIEAALKAVAGTTKAIYVCADHGPITEITVTIDKANDGLRMFGGFSCAGGAWTYSTSAAAILAPSIRGTALTVQNLAKGALFSDFAIVTLDALPDASAIAAIVANSVGVTLRRTTITAGAGGAGSSGGAGVAGGAGAAAGAAQSGMAGTCTSAPAFQAGGSWTSASACGSTGGIGGSAFQGAAGSGGASGLPDTGVVPAMVNNAGPAGAAGFNGSPGAAGPSGTVGAIGTFTQAGYTVAASTAGASGHVGQGGGGGGASAAPSGMCVGASGGAGGLGGCGGGGGGAGLGGGASIALLSWASTVTLDGAKLIAKNGGGGGAGGSAAIGGPGGAAGTGGAASTTGTVIAAGGNGGTGGAGGDGGGGAGGSGGPSFAIVYFGTAPSQLNATTLTFGAGGAPGTGGSVAPAMTNKAPDGAIGAAAATFQSM